MGQGRSCEEATCSVARAIERIGDTWSLLLLREAFYGATRFEQFQKRIGISPIILVRRLAKLIDEGSSSNGRTAYVRLAMSMCSLSVGETFGQSC
ncbi:winged helix-turn-helix transcriptional regulator [Cupriavidus necator]|uniref:winged helix-turn-helix transcriptional regulator n=1 Tax=Cupriavidus necator TaxID=106590 RepID=UPI0039C05996